MSETSRSVKRMMLAYMYLSTMRETNGRVVEALAYIQIMVGMRLAYVQVMLWHIFGVIGVVENLAPAAR